MSDRPVTMTALPDEVGIDTAKVIEASDALDRHGRQYGEVGGAGVPVPGTIPEDHFELVDVLRNFEQARQAFARSFSAGLTSAAVRVAEVGLDAAAFDRFDVPVPLPDAAER